MLLYGFISYVEAGFLDARDFNPERFTKELEIRKDVRKGIETIKKDIEDGKKVYLFCYCKKLERCHRVLVGEYLEQMGLEVDFRREKIEEDFFQLNMFE